MNRANLAELVGTFGIVFAPVALSATGSMAGGDSTLLGAAWVSGLAVLAMIVIFGSVSGAHFNPAVTIGFAAAGKFDRKEIVPYILAQVSGALLAAGVCALLYGPGHGVHLPADPTATVRNLGTEFVLTFMLMATILGSIRHKGNALIPPVAIGLIVVVDVLIGGPVTGGSMNPARSLGPAIFGGTRALESIWLYLMAPPLGAVAASIGLQPILRELE